MRKTVEIIAGTDELGEMEEFTWDLLPVIEPHATTHLDKNGLPKVGTRMLELEIQIEHDEVIPISDNLARVRDGDLLLSDTYLTQSQGPLLLHRALG